MILSMDLTGVKYMKGRLPDFLGLGVQKGGTTSLHRLLEMHPGAWLPPAKELHFFSLHHHRGEAWYREQFVSAQPQQRCGEITPYYLFHPQAPARIHALLPHVKLIALLRDPVERTLSQYFHARRLGLEPLELKAALLAEPERLAEAEAVMALPDGRHISAQEHSYLSRSRYEQQLERYEALFSANQLLILRSEDFFADPQPVWLKLLAFLGLEVRSLPERLRPENAGQGEARGVDPVLRLWLRQQLEPTYAAMEQRYGLRFP